MQTLHAMEGITTPQGTHANLGFIWTWVGGVVLNTHVHTHSHSHTHMDTHTVWSPGRWKLN